LSFSILLSLKSGKNDHGGKEEGGMGVPGVNFGGLVLETAIRASVFGLLLFLC
jgi:hypothetical protein